MKYRSSSFTDDSPNRYPGILAHCALAVDGEDDVTLDQACLLSSGLFQDPLDSEAFGHRLHAHANAGSRATCLVD